MPDPEWDDVIVFLLINWPEADDPVCPTCGLLPFEDHSQCAPPDPKVVEATRKVMN